MDQNTMLRYFEEIENLHQEIGAFRTTLQKAVRAGELLDEIKNALPHGEFQKTCRSMLPHIGKRSLEVYRNCFLGVQEMGWSEAQLAAHQGGIESFQQIMRKGKARARKDEQKAMVAEAIAFGAPADERYVAHHADCREFSWPDQVDMICTDPPWSDMDLYRWLAEFTRDRLRQGRIALVQCATEDIGNICNIFQDIAGLRAKSSQFA